jgi:plasmid stabilization system protein ParE
VTRVRFVEEAEAELLHEVEYYAQIQARGAVLFREAVESAVTRVLNFPKAGPPYLVKTRRMFVQGYPFFLVYREEPGEIVIYAVVNEVRRPGYWKERCK